VRLPGSHKRSFARIFSEAGLVEHDADEIWSTQVGVASEALARAGLTGSDIAAIGITNQRETRWCGIGVRGNRFTTDRVQDRRTADFCSELKTAGHEARIRAEEGLRWDAYFSGTKVRWLLENVRGA